MPFPLPEVRPAGRKPVSYTHLEVVDVEDKTTFNGGIHLSLQLHAGMQQGGSTGLDPLPHFLSDGNGCYQLSYTVMLVFPAQIQKTQADVLEKVFPPEMCIRDRYVLQDMAKRLPKACLRLKRSFCRT